MSDSLKRSHKRFLLTKEAGEQVVLCGCCQRRDHGGLIFVDLRDRAGIVQITLTLTMQAIVYDC